MEKCNGIEALLPHDVAFVAERLESIKAVIVACAAHADSTERYIQILDLDNRVVYAGGTGCRVL